MTDYYKKYLKYKKKYLDLLNKNNSFINKLIWRRAEKHFSPGKVNIEPIIKAIINAPSSFGIQPFHVLAITNPQIKITLKEACFNQTQIEECYCLFIFCAMKKLEKRIDDYVNQSGFTHKESSIINYVNKLSSQLDWSKMQAYIALGFGMAAAMELNIASCPMEGFKPDEVSKILKLDNNLQPCVLLTVGNKKNDYELEKRFRFKDMITILN